MVDDDERDPDDGRGRADAAARGRAGRMGRRLLRELRTVGLSDPETAAVLAAYRLAMEPRAERLAEDAPAYLHPGRTVVVLLADVDEIRPASLAWAPVVESERPDLRVPPDRIEEVLGERSRARAAEVPPSGAPGLAERLVTADREVQLVALAERLDQLRHAHLWDDRERQRRAWAEARDVYLPVAARVHPVFERRYGWWCRKLEKALG